MFITFHSQDWNSIIMNREVAVTLLKMAGHSGTVPSAWLAADIPDVIARLNHGLDAAEPRGRSHAKGSDPDEPPPVGLRVRAFPLIQLLQAAAAKGRDVTWEAGAAVI